MKTFKEALTLAQVAQILEAEVVGNPEHLIKNVSDLSEATFNDLAFVGNQRYVEAMKLSKAGAIIVSDPALVIAERNFLIHSDPTRAFQQILEYFHSCEDSLSGFEGIHPTAVIHPSARIGAQVKIGPHAVVDRDVVIGQNSQILSGVYIGPKSSIGSDCLIYSNVVIRERCQIGNRVILQSGVVIGSCGFGYTTDRYGKHNKLTHFGGVIIEDDVEIGANATIDQGRFRPTRIGSGSKLDNLVQIGHHVEIGLDNLIVAQTGIAGSSRTGKHVVLGGQVAVAGHIELDDGVMVGGKSGVSKSLKTGKYRGIPAVPVDEFQRNAVYLRQIQSYVETIRELEKRVSELESRLVAQEP